MEIFKSLESFSHASPVSSWGLLMGNFDGLHLGHRDLISKAHIECKKQGLDLVVLSFRPHPICILKPNYQPFLLNTYQDKRELLKLLGVKFFIEMSFDRDLSTEPPEFFLEKHLLKYSQLKALYFGYDFTFGANKKGSYDFVKRYCAKRLMVKKFQIFRVNQKEISSTLIRKLIEQGNIEEANKMLGRQFSLVGLVVKGRGRGREIGFPTANIQLYKDLIIPKDGVYTTYTMLRGMNYKSITNIGKNPTFSQSDTKQVETYIFDFDDDIYGESIRVKFKSFIRDEKKFNSVNELVAQIKRDCQKAH